MLLADLNTIKLMSFDTNYNRRVKTFKEGGLESNYVALTYSSKTETVFWSDVSR